MMIIILIIIIIENNVCCYVYCKTLTSENYKTMCDFQRQVYPDTRMNSDVKKRLNQEK